jgi:hypothetical protein
LASFSKYTLHILKVRYGGPCTELSDTEEADLVRELHSSLIVAALKHLKSERSSEAVTGTSGVHKMIIRVISKTNS